MVLTCLLYQAILYCVGVYVDLLYFTTTIISEVSDDNFTHKIPYTFSLLELNIVLGIVRFFSQTQYNYTHTLSINLYTIWWYFLFLFFQHFEWLETKSTDKLRFFCFALANISIMHRKIPNRFPFCEKNVWIYSAIKFCT